LIGGAKMYYGWGSQDSFLSESEVTDIILNVIPPSSVNGKKILVLTPDRTRTFPHGMFIRIFVKAYGRIAKKIDFMVALGTHRILTDRELEELFEVSEFRALLTDRVSFLNHRWDVVSTFKKIGYLGEDEIRSFTEGIFSEEVEITINRAVFEYDLIVILGPVFPHEIVGFSGGYKYFFPGISGGKFLHFFHWLGAVITNMKIIGRIDTPVRRLINRAAEFLELNIVGISTVLDMDRNLKGLYAGDVNDAWLKAAELSSLIHVKRVPHPFRLIIGVTSDKYDELWTGGKTMYKLEPVVENGGRLIIYAPHLKTISYTWGKYLHKIGYHIRDYFLSQMERFRDIPKAVLAHSSHVKGTGIYQNGIEEPRIDVILATSIPESVCREINLGYLNPEGLNLDELKNREEEGILVVENAGEILYRLEDDI